MAAQDFRFRSQLNVPGVASVLANRGVREEQIKSSREQRKRAKLNQLLNVMSTGAALARTVQGIQAQNVATQQAQQTQKTTQTLADTTARQAPGALPAGVSGPETSGVAGVRAAALLNPEAASKGVLQGVFPEKDKTGKSPLGSLVNMRNSISDTVNFALDPDSPEHKTLTEQLFQLDVRIAELGGLPTPTRPKIQLPKPPPKKKTNPLTKILDKLKGPKFKNPEEVKAAIASGDISREQGLAILRKDFGFE